MFTIFGIITIIGANLLGDYTFAPELLFGDPSPAIPGIFSYGWFIWIFMLQPAIWEEITFRGVMIPMLLKKYSQKAAIFISSILFGLAHTFNIINVLLIGGDPTSVLFQAIYTFFIGLIMGYSFIRTKSLIPSIIFHYLIDTIGLILITTAIENIIIRGFFAIAFMGILPAVLGILFIKFLSKKWNNEILIIKKELIEKN
jgi:membrane protease YdiL (CAAX protease family)